MYLDYFKDNNYRVILYLSIELEKDKQSYFKNYYTSNHPLF